MAFYSLVGYVLTPVGKLISSNQIIQDVTRILVSHGKVAESQILDIEAQLANDELSATKAKNTFYYANNFEFILTIRTSPLNYQEKKHIFGGKVENKRDSANSLHYNQISLLM